MSETELLRLTFRDRGALEREIATNLRYGRIFVGEILKYPVLTDGVIVIVHPVHGGELKLPAQVVMVNPDGPMRGTGLALRAFGPSDVEAVQAFARETASAGGARAGGAPQPSAAKPARSEDDWSDLAADPPPGNDRFRRENTGSMRQPAGGARPGSSTATPAARSGDGFGRERTGSMPQPAAARNPGSSAAHPAARAAREESNTGSMRQPDPRSPADNPGARPPSDDFRRETAASMRQPGARGPGAAGPAERGADARSGSDDFGRESTASMRQPAMRGARPGSDELSRERTGSMQQPAARRPGSSAIDRAAEPEGFDRDRTAEHTPGGRSRAANQPAPGRPPSDRTDAAMRARSASQLGNRAVRPATEVNEVGSFDRERTASMPQANARGRSSTNIRPATEVSASPQPSAARARPGSGVANAAVRPATEVVDARARVDRDSDAPPPQPNAAPWARAPGGAAQPVVRPAVQPARTAAANAAIRAPAPENDDWSDFEHGPEPETAKVTPAVANTNAMPTAPPPAPATLAPAAPPVRTNADEDDWSDFEHGPEPTAVAPAPQPTAAAAVAAALESAPAAPASQPGPPAASAGDEDDWSDFEYGPEPSAAAAAPQPQAAPAAREPTTVEPPPPAPELAVPAASVDEQEDEGDDWSDFEHGPEPSGAPPTSAAELAPPSAADVDSDDGLVLPLGLGADPSTTALSADPNSAVTMRPAPSDDTLNELVERTREADEESSADDASFGSDEEAAFDEDPNFDPDERNPDVQSANRQERLRSLNVVEQLKIARRGELADRVVIERLYGKTVWEALLQNPRISLPEVARIARKGTVPRPLLDTILENGNWLRDASVRRALLSNPKVTGEAILKLLRLTPRHELKVMEKATAFPMAVRDAVRKLLRE